MEIIYGARASGKTTVCIKISAKTGHRIVCLNKETCSDLMLSAKQLGLIIPEPMTYREFISGKQVDANTSGLIMDNADQFFNFITRPVSVITVSEKPESVEEWISKNT